MRVNGQKLGKPNSSELFEVGNSLRSGVLSKRLTVSQASELFKQFLNLEIKLKPVNYDLVLKLAISHNLSFYDATYLFLSTKIKCPLLTLDKKLLSSTKVWQFSSSCYITQTMTKTIYLSVAHHTHHTFVAGTLFA